MNILDMFAERFPIVATAIRSTYNYDTLRDEIPEVPDEILGDFRDALAAIPDSLIPVIESASLKLARVVGGAVEQFVKDVGRENIMAGVGYIMRKYGEEKFVN